MIVNPTVPEFLQRRVAGFETSTQSQDIQLGAQLYQQAQQMRNQQRQLAMQEEAHRLKIEGNRFVSAGAIELGRLMEEGGNSNLYADPSFEGKLWSIGQRYPQLLESEVFQGATKVVENAKTAKARAEIMTLTQQSITDRSDSAIQSRFDLLTQRLDGMTQMEGLKQENREALTTLRNDLNILRDSLKPTRTGQLVHDLTETDLVAMRSELSTLDNIFKEGKLKGTKKPGMFSTGFTETPEAEYERRKQEILKKYDAKRVGTPRPAEATAPATDKRVRVVSPSGKVGNIPESQLEEALKQGYKPAP